MSSRRDAQLDAAQPTGADQPILGSRVGWIAGWDPARGVLVDFEGNTRGPLVARSAVALDAGAVQAAARTRSGAVLLFENGEPGLPIIMGVIQPVSTTPLLDEALASATATVPDQPLEARLDGRTVVLEGKDEIVLKCGRASLTLRRNGKVVIRGVQLETVATGVHRIKGGSVEIN